MIDSKETPTRIPKETPNMTTVKLKVAALVEQMPDADSPGKPSKLTGPTREAADRIVSEILDGGRESLLELIGMIRDANGFGEKNYKPGYVLHCAAVAVGRPAREEKRREFAQTIASRLGPDGPSKGIQGYLIRELQVAGGREVVPALGRVLLDDELCGYAVQALVAIGAGAAAVLRDALPRVRGKNRVSVVQALGVLRDAKSARALRSTVTGDDADARLAAAWALANIGDPYGPNAVLEAAGKAEGWERIQLVKACLLLAETFLSQARKAEAARVYTTLREASSDPADAYVREAAERGLAGVATD